MMTHNSSLAALAVGLLMSTGGAVATIRPAVAQQPPCLHGGDETPEQANRRRQALQAARAINTSEANLFRANNGYTALAALPVPALPDGFGVNLAADAAGYAFAVKDLQDACRFAFFSDQDGVIYTAQPIR